MLARSFRLNKSKDIMRVLRTGKRASAGPFMVYALASRTGQTRATVVISKKVDKRAVVRNRCRRRVREAIREAMPTLAPGFDILVYIKQDIRMLPAADVRRELERGYRRTGAKS